MALLDPIRAVILDLDGTLVDTLGDFELALSAMLGDLGVAPDAVERGFIGRTVGKGSEYLVLQTLGHVGLATDDRALLDHANDRYQHHYGRINGQASELFPGAAEGVQALRALGLPLACLTNKPGRYAQELLAAKGLASAFDRVFGGDAFARKKPDPLPLMETCRALGHAPAHTLMVGDSLNDAQAAHAAGCPVALVTYGYNHGRPIREVRASAYIDRLDELASMRSSA
ncbi:MAG: phosphoglycolate phosphatase [Betaproteobacteria bacterium]|jgi:phosphoglycolate phosphatase|nr:phosphoglycolate phosphatase [Betaproteobacteria bacterium]NBT10703.1 phosphoglycolate phosphatase [Betaproteobacteria bacterium]NBU50532.1 phosphoglycolate phosphatase [Betaproteobacteria bacterium]NBX96869.1 phosphoglycolate phosphatase [Betaproteobacteria bacterium]